MVSESVVNPAVRMVTVAAEYQGQRIDNFLMRELKGVPKSRIYNILRRGEVRVNKSRVKPDYKLISGDVIRVPPVRVATSAEVPVSTNFEQNIRQSILHEDDELIIVNKPSGLAVHGGSGVSLGLIEALRQVFPEHRHLELVHRLDRDTSGCVMISKKRSALKQLHEMLKSKSMVDKRYLAAVAGVWPARKQQVNAPLQKNVLQSGERMVRVDLEGKKSLTQYSVVGRGQGVSLIEARPITGRTHQIRVHCLHAGHAILGDDKYGDDQANLRARELGLRRLFLHAHSLSFMLNDRQVRVSAPLPLDLSKFLNSCGISL